MIRWVTRERSCETPERYEESRGGCIFWKAPDNLGQMESESAEVTSPHMGAAFPDEADLCRDFTPRVRALALRYLRDRSQADDVVQDVLSAVILKVRAGQVERVGALPAYVMATCRKRIADFHRKEARRHALWQEFGGPEVTLSGTVRAPEVCEIDIDRVVMAMGPLSGKERQVLNETFSLERSADEIAQALGMTASHVRVVRSRALEKVRSALGFKDRT